MFFSLLNTFLNPFKIFKSTSLNSFGGMCSGAAEDDFIDDMTEVEEPVEPFIQIHTTVDRLVAFNDIGDVTFRDLRV